MVPTATMMFTVKLQGQKPKFEKRTALPSHNKSLLQGQTVNGSAQSFSTHGRCWQNLLRWHLFSYKWLQVSVSFKYSLWWGWQLALQRKHLCRRSGRKLDAKRIWKTDLEIGVKIVSRLRLFRNCHNSSREHLSYIPLQQEQDKEVSHGWME